MDATSAARAMAAECLCFRSRRLARIVTRAYDEVLRPLGIEATQLTLLNALGAGGEAGFPMRRVADFLAMDLSTLSRNLRPLERDGLVELDRLPGDRRVRVARLTPAGRARVEAAWPLWQRATATIAEALKNDGGGDLRQQLDQAVEALRSGGA